MNSKIKTFFSMLKFEVIRIFRNKIVLCLLLFFPAVLTLLFAMLDTSKGFSAAIYTDGLQSEQIEVLHIIDDYYNSDKLIYVNSVEDGLILLQRGELKFFIAINAETDPVSAIFYYDQSNNSAVTMVERLERTKTEYAFESLTEFLSGYGITIDEDYFNLIEFKSSIDGEDRITFKMRTLPLEISVFVAIIIMFGLAFSISRDNETGVAKQLSYTPIGVNKYLFSKIIPYFVLGIFQTLLLLIIGRYIYYIDYATDMWFILLVSTAFVTANICLGMLVCLVKNQTAAAFISISAVLFPMIVVAFSAVESFPLFIQILLYCLPITAYMTMLKYLMFSGVFLSINLVILIIQSLIYYLLVVLIIKRRTGK